jgi:hypothetical protein
MAYRVSQYQEVYTTGSVLYTTAIGVQVPFQGTPPSSSIPGSDAVFNVNYTTKDQIKSNIINFLLTDQGERYFNTKFGSNLRRYLFSNITTEGFEFEPFTFSDGRVGQFTNLSIQDLQINIKNDLTNNFPMIKVISVNITPLSDSNQISININYSFDNVVLETLNIMQ